MTTRSSPSPKTPEEMALHTLERRVLVSNPNTFEENFGEVLIQVVLPGCPAGLPHISLTLLDTPGTNPSNSGDVQGPLTPEIFSLVGERLFSELRSLLTYQKWASPWVAHLDLAARNGDEQRYEDLLEAMPRQTRVALAPLTGEDGQSDDQVWLKDNAYGCPKETFEFILEQLREIA